MAREQKRQEVKDALWRLDEEVSRLSGEASRRVGEAWKAYVEHEKDWRKHLEHARIALRDAENKVSMAWDSLDVKD